MHVVYSYIENLETRLKKMEKLLEQLQSDKADEGATEANNDNDNQWQKKRKRSVDEEVEESSEASSLSPKISAAAAEQQTFNKFADRSNKVVRYLGSASGYYLMRNMLSPDNNKGGRSSVQQQSGTAAAANNAVPSTSEPVFAFPDKNGKCRIRKVDLFDDDLVMVRDTTEAENASQLTIEKQEQSEDFVPREILAALVKWYVVQNAPRAAMTNAYELATLICQTLPYLSSTRNNFLMLSKVARLQLLRLC